MAKKKVSRPPAKSTSRAVKKAEGTAKKAPVVKKVVKKKAVKKAASTTKLVRSTKRVATKGASSTAIKASVKPAAPPKMTAVSTPEVSLGRPLVTQEEKLYMLFHDDYHSRQVFEFLRVETVRDLEQFSPQQIVHILSKPIRMTVDRIRQRLAQYKRSLRDDEEYAAEFRQQQSK